MKNAVKKYWSYARKQVDIQKENNPLRVLVFLQHYSINFMVKGLFHDPILGVLTNKKEKPREKRGHFYSLKLYSQTSFGPKF